MYDLLFYPIISTLLLLISAFYLFGSKSTAFFSILIAVFSLFLSLFYYVVNSFTGEGINEAVFFHIIYGFNGINIFNYKIEIFLIFFCICFFVFLVFFARKKIVQIKRKPRLLIELTILFACSCFSIAVHPATLDIGLIVESFFASQNSIKLNQDLGDHQYLINNSKNKKSLVYIYAESLERTFFDEKIFPELVINLKNLEKKSISFQGVRQAPMTDWTIAGMVSSQCGVPLATFKSNRNDFSGIDNFVPGATCMGDIFKSAGYKNFYIGGADLNFAGKGNFYKSHGFDEIFGLKEIQSIYENSLPTSKWGIYDDALFDFSYEKYKSLALQKDPFVLFILTADTHGPSGHETPECKSIKYKNGDVKMLNAVKCADFLIDKFLSKIMSVKTEQDVIFVLGSDHLQMNNDASFILTEHETARTNLFMILEKGKAPKIVSKPSSTLDIAPTVMSIMGWDINNFAFGRNLLSEELTLVEKYGEENFFNSLKNWRLNLWKTWIEK